MKSNFKQLGLLALIAAALGIVTVQTQAASTNLMAYWDFNTASDPGKSLDKIYGFTGLVTNGAAFTDDAGGRTSLAGDRAMHLYTAATPNATMHVLTGVFLNAAAANDQITIAFW